METRNSQKLRTRSVEALNILALGIIYDEKEATAAIVEV